MRFDLSEVGTVSTATLTLDRLNANSPTTVYIYGVDDGVTGEADWDESTITWSNAPANATGSANGMTASATQLGSVLLTSQDSSLVFANQDLVDFLNDDSNCRATIVITGSTDSIFNSFYTKESAYDPPELTVTYTGSPDCTPPSGGGGCEEIPDPPGTTVLDLSDYGLDPGESVDSYLTSYLKSGNECHIPAGTYTWGGGGFGNNLNNCSLVGDGTVIFQIPNNSNRGPNLFVTSGHFEIRNVTIKGTKGDGRFAVRATSSGGKVTLRNFNQPDGAYYGDSIGVFVRLEHAGTIELIDCHIEDFPNNGLYGSAPGHSGGGGGVVHVLRGLFKNNNISGVRLGSDGSSVVDTVVVNDDLAPQHPNGRNQRGIWIREDGDNMVIRNCDVYHTVSSWMPVGIIPREGHSSGTIEDLRIHTSSSSYAITINVSSGGWDADNVDVTGSGNLNFGGTTGYLDTTDVCQGGGCDVASSEQPAVCW
jgi:hypothetical protein